MNRQTPRHATGTDALMLGLETPTAHYHTLKMGVLDMSGEPGGYSFEAARELLAQRLHLLPPFRWKLLPSPLGIHHPLIVDDPAFDLDKHIALRRVPPPGDLPAMCSVISELAGEPMDRGRPLWQLYILEGVPGKDRVGFLLKIHHAVADGTANVLLMKAFCNEEPGAAAPTPPGVWEAGATPSWLRRLAGDFRAVGGAWRRQFPRILEARRRKNEALGRDGAEQAAAPPATSDAPVAPWNGPLTPRRELACASLALADVMEVKSAYGVSVNDVALSIVAGALRRYMIDRDGLPQEPLVAVMPVSTRTEQEMVPWGNRVSTMAVALRTDIDDPVQRLQASHEAAQLSKQHFERNRGLDISSVAELVPDFLGGSLLPKMLRSKARGGVSLLSGNLGVSNVPGPRSALYIQNTKVESFFSAGMLHEGAGLGITVWSYADRFNFTLLTCPELVPEVGVLADYLELELSQLARQVRRRAA